MIKTTADGKAFIFNVKDISYSGEADKLNEWINNLQYDIYNYGHQSSNHRDSPIISLGSEEDSLATQLLANGFNLEDLNLLDGSGYLIDTNLDGKADMISLMLIDQGWFDTRPDVIGLIGDPLTPIAYRDIKWNNNKSK